uniref:rRNA N-glycosylase n=1 Tax=Oryza barthii TaxID=65489 RepID=A0A0D3G216_9ORYZ
MWGTFIAPLLVSPWGTSIIRLRRSPSMAKRLPLDEDELRTRTDIPRYSLPVTATKEEFIRLMEQRHERMTQIAPITIDGVPVTPPWLEDPNYITYHIVELKDKAEGSSVDILFLERDLYYVAFRPRFEGDGRDADPGGWFAFTDVKMPDYLRYEEVAYNSGYNGNIKETISTGSRCLQEIRIALWEHTVNNRMFLWPERERAHQAVMVMLSETQRFRSVQAHALNNLSQGTCLVLGKDLARRVNDWGVLSRCGLREVDEDKKSSLDEVANYNLDLTNEQTGEKDFGLLISPNRGEILIILFQKDLVLNIMKQRNRGVGSPWRIAVEY